MQNLEQDQKIKENIEKNENALKNPDQDQEIKENKEKNENAFKNQEKNSRLNSKPSENKSKEKQHYKPYHQSSHELFLFQFICNPYYKIRSKIISPFTKKIVFFNKPIGWFFTILPLFILAIVFTFVGWFVFDKCPHFIPNLALGILIALSMKNSLFTFLTGIGFEQQILIHKIFSYILVITGLIHGIHYYNREIEAQTWIGTAFFVVICLAAFVGIFFKFFFKGSYELFYIFHVVFFIATVVLGIVHDSNGALIGGIIWLVDKVIGMVISHFVYKKGTKKCKVSLICEDVVQLKFDKKEAFFNYKPGQFVKVIIPKVTPFELHPFSIESSPYEKEVSIMIKVCGNWTRELKKVYLKELEKKLQQEKNFKVVLDVIPEGGEIIPMGGPNNLYVDSPNSEERKFKDTQNSKKEPISQNDLILASNNRIEITLPILIDGPHGNSMIDLDSEEYQTLLFISGGIGITPLLSFVKNLFFEIKNGRKIKKIVFVWSGRNKDFLKGTNIFEIFEKYFPKDLYKETFLEIYMHLTKEENLDFLDHSNFSNLKKNSIYKGRPNYDMIFGNLNKYCNIEKIKKFGVFTCGPKKMMDNVIGLCHKYDGKNNVGIRFHYETFGFLDHLF